MICKCGAEGQKHGVRGTKNGKYQRWRCTSCGSTWTDETAIKEAKLRIDEK